MFVLEYKGYIASMYDANPRRPALLITNATGVVLIDVTIHSTSISMAEVSMAIIDVLEE